MSEEQTPFYKTEVGKVLMHGIHEHNSAIGQINNLVKFIDHSLKNNLDNKEEIEKSLDMILVAKKKAEESMDYIYKHFSSKHDSK